MENWSQKTDLSHVLEITEVSLQNLEPCAPLFRWFKFTLKPPNRITRDKLRLAIWDTSAWPFLVKFGHNGP